MAVPESRKAKLVGYLIESIANSPTFVNWVGAQEPDGAKARIFVDTLWPLPADGTEYTRAELEAMRPYALIHDETWRAERQAVPPSPNQPTTQTGELLVAFVADVSQPAAAAGPYEVYLEFWNPVGKILDEMAAQAFVAGRLNFALASTEEGHMRASRSEVPHIGDYIACEIAISYDAVR